MSTQASQSVHKTMPLSLNGPSSSIWKKLRPSSFIYLHAGARQRSCSKPFQKFSTVVTRKYSSHISPQEYLWKCPSIPHQRLAHGRIARSLAAYGGKSTLPTVIGRRGYKTVQEMRSRYKFGPFSMVAVVVFLSTGIGMGFYFRYEKERLQRQRIAEASKGVGKPKVGGTFELIDQDGKVWSSEEMKGKFSLVYFGFTHCPDICPEELDKMAEMLDLVSAALPPSSPSNPTLLPIFITCDPARDTPPILKTYLQEFHPDIVGLTGTWEQIKVVCKLYRVYFSTPQGVKPGMDYLVDHSIYFYLMDPEGDFVEAIGRTHSAGKGAKIITEHMSDWKGRIKK